MKKIINISVFLILILSLNFIFSSLPRREVVLKNFNGLKKTLVGAGIFSFLYLIDRYKGFLVETDFKENIKKNKDVIKYNENIEKQDFKKYIYNLFNKYQNKKNIIFKYNYQLNKKNLINVLNEFKQFNQQQKNENKLQCEEIELTEDQIKDILKKAKDFDIYYKNPFERLIGWIGGKFKGKENKIVKKDSNNLDMNYDPQEELYDGKINVENIKKKVDIFKNIMIDENLKLDTGFDFKKITETYLPEDNNNNFKPFINLNFLTKILLKEDNGRGQAKINLFIKNKNDNLFTSDNLLNNRNLMFSETPDFKKQNNKFLYFNIINFNILDQDQKKDFIEDLIAYFIFRKINKNYLNLNLKLNNFIYDNHSFDYYIDNINIDLLFKDEKENFVNENEFNTLKKLVLDHYKIQDDSSQDNQQKKKIEQKSDFILRQVVQQQQSFSTDSQSQSQEKPDFIPVKKKSEKEEIEQYFKNRCFFFEDNEKKIIEKKNNLLKEKFLKNFKYTIKSLTDYIYPIISIYMVEKKKIEDKYLNNFIKVFSKILKKNKEETMEIINEIINYFNGKLEGPEEFFPRAKNFFELSAENFQDFSNFNKINNFKKLNLLNFNDLCINLINAFDIKVSDDYILKKDGGLSKRNKSEIKSVLNSINNKKNNEIEFIKKKVLSNINEEVEVIFDEKYYLNKSNNNNNNNISYIVSSFSDELKIIEFIKNKDISIFFKLNNDKDILLLEAEINENKKNFNLNIRNSKEFTKYFNENKIEIKSNNLENDLNNLNNLNGVLNKFSDLTLKEKIYQPCFLSALMIIKLFNENKMNDINYLKNIFYSEDYIFKSFFNFAGQIDIFEILQMHKLYDNKILEIFREKDVFISDLLQENNNFLKNAKIFNNLKNNIYIVQRQVGNIDNFNNFIPNIGSHFYLIINDYIINPYFEYFKFVKKENFYELIEDSNQKDRRIKLTFIPINQNLLDILITYKK